jgi:NAD(P)-dependent dehydrogenase (short-subunit alcohol dehydrogenase family)
LTIRLWSSPAVPVALARRRRGLRTTALARSGHVDAVFLNAGVEGEVGAFEQRGGAAGLSPYVASKHAVVGLMRSIGDQASPGHGDEVKAGFTGRIPLGRYVTDEECAAVAVYLVSPASAGCTGNTYLLDGGLTAH